MNPLLSSSKLKAMAKKATNLFHVAEESPSVMKLFSKKTISKLTNREISQLIKTTISKKQVSKILPSLTKTTNIDKVLIDYITDTGGVVYGGKATEVYTSKLRKIFGFRKSTTDFDVLYTTPKKNRDTLYNYLTNRYPGRKFSLSKVKGRETYSISYQGSKIIDFSKKGKNVKYVYNVDGTRIIAKSEQAKTLIAAFYTVGEQKTYNKVKRFKKHYLKEKYLNQIY